MEGSVLLIFVAVTPLPQPPAQPVARRRSSGGQHRHPDGHPGQQDHIDGKADQIGQQADQGGPDLLRGSPAAAAFQLGDPASPGQKGGVGHVAVGCGKIFVLHLTEQVLTHHNPGHLLDGVQIIDGAVEHQSCQHKPSQGPQQCGQGSAGLQQAQQGRAHQQGQQVGTHRCGSLSQADPQHQAAGGPGLADHKGTAGQDAVPGALFFLIHLLHLTPTV